MSQWQKASGNGLINDPGLFDGIGAGAMWWAIGAGAIFLPIAMLWIGPLYKKIGAPTAPAALQRIFGTKIGWFHAAFQTMTWTGIGTSELVATGTAIFTLCNASGIAISLPISIIIAFILTTAYVLFGGMLQMAWLNIINAIVMLICSYLAVVVLGADYLSRAGVIDGSGWAGVATVWTQAGYGSLTSQFGTMGLPPVWLGVIIPVIVLHLTAGAVSQTMMQPFFAAKDQSACRKGVFLGCGINILSSLPWIFLAMAAVAVQATTGFNNIPETSSLHGAEIMANGGNAVPLIASEGLPVPVIGLLMTALLCATLSTGGGVVLANGNVIANDIWIGCMKPKMEEKKKMTANRVGIIIAAIILLPGALIMMNEFAFNLFLWVFSFGMPIFMILIIGYHWKVSRTCAWVTVIICYVVNCLFTFVNFGPVEQGGLGVFSGGLGAMLFSPPAANLYATIILSIVLSIVLHLFKWKDEKPAWKKSHADVIAANLEAQKHVQAI
jgi:SSS family solute:Na+ symporter